MRRSWLISSIAILLFAAIGFAHQASPGGPYKVLQRAKVGGEGGWDYIYADVTGRRLYIARNAAREIPATDTAPAVAAAVPRIAVYDLDTLKPVGEVVDTPGNANGATVDPKSGHGFATSHPEIAMFDTKTLKMIKKIDIAPASGDGIFYDAFSEKIFVYCHPTKEAVVIDPKDGTVLGKIDLGGVPEQSASDGKGTLYVVLQAESSVAVVDIKSMKTTAHYDFKDKGGRCNGLALDNKNHILFAACGNSSMTPVQGQPAQPTMVIMSATDGKILAALPYEGGSDGAMFNPATMEAFNTGGGKLTVIKETSPTSFEVIQTLDTIPGARTIAFDSKTNRVFTMGQERGPVPAGAAAGGRGQGPVIPGSFTIIAMGK